MKQFISGVLVATLALAVYACTNPSAGGGTGGSDPVLFKVNGRNVTAGEFFASKPARDAIREYVFYESMKNEAKKYGAKIDEAELKKQMEETKKNVTMQMGSTWEEFLKQQGMTEQEFMDRNRDMMLFQALNKSRTKVTEEEAKKVWETDKDALINQYISKNHLPDSEKAKVTYDKVKDLAHERVQMNKGPMMQGEVVGDIILNASLDLSAVKDKTKAKKIEDLILGQAKEDAKKQIEESKKQQEEAASGKAPGGGGPLGAPQEVPAGKQRPPAENARPAPKPAENKGKGGK